MLHAIPFPVRLCITMKDQKKLENMWVLGTTKRRLKARAAREGKTMIQLVDELSKTKI